MTKHVTTKEPYPSRREFIQASTAAAVGTAVVSQLGAIPAVHAAGRDSIRVGLIGCGGRGSGAAENCLKSSENVSIAALGDVFRGQVDGLREKLRQEFSDKLEVTDDRCFVGLDAYK